MDGYIIDFDEILKNLSSKNGEEDNMNSIPHKNDGVGIYNLKWTNSSTVDDCKNRCEFYEICLGNRDVCPKQVFEEVLDTLTPREHAILKLKFGYCSDKPLSIDEIGKYLSNIPCEESFGFLGYDYEDYDDNILDESISDLEFSPYILKNLKNANLTTIKDLLNCSVFDLFKIDNLGKKSIMDIKSELEDYGFIMRDGKSYCDALTNKALRKLRCPTRSKKLKGFLIWTDLFEIDSFYSRLCKEIFGQYEDIVRDLGLDYSIIDRDTSFDKSILAIKKELNSSLDEFIELRPFFSNLKKIQVATLKHLLCLPREEIFHALDCDDYKMYTLEKRLQMMGYKFRGFYYSRTPIYLSQLLDEFLKFNLFPSLDENNLLDMELPSGLVVPLLRNNIHTIKELFALTKAQIDNFNESDKTKDYIWNYIKTNRIKISLPKYDVCDVVVDFQFVETFYWALKEELHNNGYSLKSLYATIKNKKITNLEDLISCLELEFSKVSIKALFCKYMVGYGIDDTILDIKIEDMDLCVRTYSALKRSNIFTFRDLVQKTEEEMLKVLNFGRKQLAEVIEKMNSYGLKLKDE